MLPSSAVRKIAFLGDYLPRKCGIATFTTDLRCAVAAQYPLIQCPVVPVNDLAVVPLMVALHRELRRGASLAEALRDARRGSEDDPVATATGLSFICLGAG